MRVSRFLFFITYIESIIMTKSIKKRNWAFIVYPESAPTNWIELLQKTGLQCAISPIHDCDANADGELKKAHYHVLACYPGPTTFNVVKSIADALNSPIPQHVESVKGYYRYLTHKDNPEKAQYLESDIKTINSFNIFDFVELTRNEIAQIKKALLKFINANKITEYCDLLDSLIDQESMSEFEVASNNTIFFNTYISSLRYKYEKNNRS